MTQELSCEDCAWKEEKEHEYCQYCIRSGRTVSKRRNKEKCITVLGKELDIPRDFYISKEMLDFVKIILTNLATKNLTLELQNIGRNLTSAEKLQRTLMAKKLMTNALMGSSLKKKKKGKK